MSIVSQTPAKPVQVLANGHAAAPAPRPTAPSVAVIIVTWNRREMASNAVAAVAKQDFPRDRIDVIVVDNASTDGTLELLTERWRPEAIIDNPTAAAHEPAFSPRSGGGSGPNTAGFRSLTIVRNSHNLGGCGGFNTGFACVERTLAARPAGAPAAALDFVWLVDDDADLPPDALTQLTRAAATDPRIGLVGSRTVNLADRRTTIETTIYLDRDTGCMGDEPPPGHPQHDAHRRWVAQTGGVRGERSFTGLRDVDIVSACSMLASWSAVQQVGFWDHRYFIYCDDADWCLRFGKAGYRVVLNLDAVVYHTPWNLKLTPARIYYAQRNLVWTLQKLLPPAQLRRVTRRWMRSILRDSLRAAICRRLFHAEVIRRTAADIASGRAGKLDRDGPPAVPLIEALRQAGCLDSRARVAFLLGHPARGAAPIDWARQFRAQVRSQLAAASSGAEPRWLEVVRNQVADAAALAPQPPVPDADRFIYGGRWPSRLRRQLTLLRYRPRAVVVFEQTNDFPAVCGRWNIHADPKTPGVAQVERDGLLRRGAFLARWVGTVIRCAAYSATVRPYTSPTKYG